MKNIINTVKGTREFYPEEMAVRQWIFENVRNVSELFGYQEFDGPFLESIDLYAAKSGEELVKEQSFVFPDRGGKLIALRPELTPSLARMIASKQNQLTFPVRWWSFGPFWRYEQPQKGRTREFFQWNIDLIGVNTPKADAELVAISAEFFKKIGITSDQVKIFVNDRRLMDREVTALGIQDHLKEKVFRIIDRKEKMSLSNWISYANDEGFNQGQVDGLIRLLSNYKLKETSEDLCDFFETIEELEVSDYVQFDPSIVRGLDYYTGIVFEANDVIKSGRAILGGGHYDNLVEEVGGKPLPGVGFAMGDVVLPILMKELDLLPEISVQPANVLVTIFNDETKSASINLANKLRKSDINAVQYLENDKLGKQLKFADRIGVKYVLILGPDEIQNKKIQVKNMISGDQTMVEMDQIADFLLTSLA